MDKTQLFGYLSLFLGPKAENAPLLEDTVLEALRDYTHWRKNYFPGDPRVLTSALFTQYGATREAFHTHLSDLLAQLRRNFPFYSPRYVAHELSDTLLPATVGYFVGTLFNPNNVTPEAAPVTTELEIEVCSEILKLVGFQPPPPPPPDGAGRIADYYAHRSREQYGWSHLTSGGTVANIEALWVARQVKYFALAVKAAATTHEIDLAVKLPNSSRENELSSDIRRVDDQRLMVLRPNESIFLLNRFKDAARRRFDWPSDSELNGRVWALLDETGLSIRSGTGHLFRRFPPALLVAGSRHYSVAKAADILGIGQSNVVHVDVDDSFRMRVDDLETKMKACLREGRTPVAVVATIGSTEEGAVDPVDQIVDLRRRLQTQEGTSFWLHLDAAWGGYLRSLFAFQPQERSEIVATKISRILDIQAPALTGGTGTDELSAWHDTMSPVMTALAATSKKRERTGDSSLDSVIPHDEFRSGVAQALSKASDVLRSGDHDRYQAALNYLRGRFRDRVTEPELEPFGPDVEGSLGWLRSFVSTKASFGRNVTINWPELAVANAFLSMPKADSVAIDPHKMGYAPYPAGCVCFRNDRVRAFILQHAPYITATDHGGTVHVPPRHAVEGDGDGKGRVVTSSFSPFMLEGSKAGAVAAGLWLATKCLPLNPRGHGLLARSSLLAARLLFEWIVRWPAVCQQEGHDIGFEAIPLTVHPPDTNLVTFCVKSKISSSLAKMNQLTSQVYERFSIQAELGEREYSYSQPFFLSQTRFRDLEYPVASVEPFLERAGVGRNVATEYGSEGLVVLRATVMNPYILPSAEFRQYDYCRVFLEELTNAASRALRELDR